LAVLDVLLDGRTRDGCGGVIALRAVVTSLLSKPMIGEIEVGFAAGAVCGKEERDEDDIHRGVATVG
jgi:hypothetical protein